MNNMNDIMEFVKGDIYTEKHHENKSPYTLRVSNRLRKTVPEGNNQLYFRIMMQIVYLLRLSPYKREILSHLGFDEELHFDIKKFEENYKNGYFPSLFIDSNDVISSEDVEKITKEVNKLKDDFDMAKKVAKIYKNVFSKVQSMFKNKKEQKHDTTITLDEYKTVFPTKEEIELIKKFFELFSEGDK